MSTTTASLVSTMFCNNGTNFINKEEQEIIEICREISMGIKHGAGGTRYIFSDNSAIIITDECWDLGIACSCGFCFEGAGHPKCEEN